MRLSITLFMFCLMMQAILIASICSAQGETTEVEMRLANGVPVEGTFKSAAPEGLTVESAKGTKVLPWKYLSAGTRWRYERPMLAELEARRIKAEKEAKAKAEAAAKAAAAKAAADAAKKAVGTNAVPPAAVPAKPIPAGAATTPQIPVAVPTIPSPAKSAAKPATPAGK